MSQRIDSAGLEGAPAWERYSPRPLTEGERWTAHALADLRRRRCRPRAWAAFIRASLERSADQRRARPDLVRQARTWGLVGAGAWVGGCAAARGHDRLQPSLVGGLVWWSAVWRMLDWHLGMAEGGDGHARERLSPADAVTLARFWLVPAAFGAAHSRRGLPAVVIVGGGSDWLDGRLARRVGRTRLGRDLDTTADLAFLTATVLAARASGRISALGYQALIARHALGLALSSGAVFGRARRPAIRARPWGAALRVGGLAIGAAGLRRTGSALLAAGSIVPPCSTAAHLSVA